ncbi:equilibrative nucleoside transporter 3 isoform X1 [Aethina tumida]|uniref:equilibrative nucleoside transporter 3 isoform X1 n=1 Tax=Aethina tumida TaxID=116153 RepID=UPI0021473BEA|nr:equilibrative nucleoside transporter 3 isoform X1 [Aethina tumida]XP_049824060.1 equilibrative nucleoside transporter 3 isoform X1 [Aethina tumida]XP_049824061.1 equilibrative nucleoside transporter 3 isoform X1 [Aethina tumida]XP_049824062.1 equilibrative nucleoside transporter 3 isoform X1 [Aethina tumida]XP_049824063.1 equilibrative nucleoside transporter 3 isoform X1 [Aethina tumida]XP_049824064.1 equilibrative nucleoside transporter 3 isoform X1 [Aethina tumida]
MNKDLATDSQDDLTKEKAKLEKTAPTDRWFLVHILFFMLGLLHFMPYTYFTCALEYWMYKFRDTDKVNWTNSDPRNTLQSQFAASTQISSSIPSVLFLGLTTIYGNMFKVKIRMYGTLFILLAAFAMFTAFIQINTDSWQTGFFILTMITIAIITVANSVLGITLFALIAKFPDIYLKTYLTGNSISGVCNSLLQIASMAFGADIKTSALIYFITGTVIVVVSTAIYLTVQHLNFYKHFMGNFGDENVENRQSESFRGMWRTFKETWAANAVFLLITLTGLVNPTITALVVSEDESGSDWATKYFVPTCTFLLFDIGDLIGRALCYIKIKYNDIVVTVINVIRLFTIFPLIMLCRTEPRNHLPILFPHDYQYMILMLTYSISAGYFFNVAYIMIQNKLPPSRVQFGYSVLTTGYGVISALFSVAGYFLVYLL